jgi:uncharacterized protein YdcH (DUF465 family)
MERADLELLETLLPTNPKLKQLVNEHKRLEKEVANVSRYSGFSPAAALREQQLKKEKLRGMDDIMSILSEYRNGSETYA